MEKNNDYDEQDMPVVLPLNESLESLFEAAFHLVQIDLPGLTEDMEWMLSKMEQIGTPENRVINMRHNLDFARAAMPLYEAAIKRAAEEQERLSRTDDPIRNAKEAFTLNVFLNRMTKK